MNPSTDVARLEELVTSMSERMATITRTLGTWVQQAPTTCRSSNSTSCASSKSLGPRWSPA